MDSDAVMVSVESPYHNDDPVLLKRNINYAIMAVKDACANHGEAPYASHLIHTQLVHNGEHGYVHDGIVDEYDLGRARVIERTNAIRRRCDKMVFYVDFGWSRGMRDALDFAEANDIPTEERRIRETFDKVSAQR